MTNMSRATRRLPVMRESSRYTFPPLLDRAHLHVARGRDRGLEQRSRCIERGQARDTALDSRASDLEAVLEHWPAHLARLGVDVRHRVDDEVDLPLRDDVEDRRARLADLGHDLW